MVLIYQQRLEEARIELAVSVRNGVRDLLSEGYTSKMNLSRYIRGQPVGFHIDGGHLYAYFSDKHENWKFWRREFWLLDKREVNPQDIPLENSQIYPIDYLLELSSYIDGARVSMSAIS